MKNGWIWKIPVQGRFGCGYVFDSDYADDEEIKKEIREHFGEVEIPRSFSFKAGYYKTPWVKNCMSVGLSSGFIEPLEATSIWVLILSLNLLLNNYSSELFNDDNFSEECRLEFNNQIVNINDQVKDFIQLHYLTKRNDSPFWKEFRTKNKISNRILNLEKCRTIEELRNYTLKNFELFSPYVFAAVNLINPEIYIRKLMTFSNDQLMEISKNKESYISSLKNFVTYNAIDHYQFLNHINKIA